MDFIFSVTGLGKKSFVQYSVSSRVRHRFHGFVLLTPLAIYKIISVRVQFFFNLGTCKHTFAMYFKLTPLFNNILSLPDKQ